MGSLKPRICCLDLDTFFVSVERILDPSLEGKPVIVGGQPGERGVVSACSYEVRTLGVRSGMSLRDAGRLAPRAIYLPTRHDTYSDYAAQVREIAARYSPEVQIASIDEMYMSFAGCEGLYAQPDDAGEDATIERTVREMTQTIKQELGLPSSAGIAASRIMAKVACVLAKPAGVRLVPAGTEALALAPLPVRKLPGVGPVAEAKLEKLGILTIGEIAQCPVGELRSVFGAWAAGMKRAALGEGRSELGPERPAFREHDLDGSVMGSISNERTFDHDVGDTAKVEAMLCSLSERVAWRARKRGVRGRTVTLKLRYASFETLTRSRTIAVATHSETEIHEVILDLYRSELEDPKPTRKRGAAAAPIRPRDRRIRLLGVGLSKLELAEQLDLLPERNTPSGRPVRAGVSAAVDDIRAKFGYEAVGLATGRRRSRPPRKG